MPSGHMLPNLVKETRNPFTCMVCGLTVARDMLNVNGIAHVDCVNLQDVWSAMTTDGNLKDKDEG